MAQATLRLTRPMKLDTSDTRPAGRPTTGQTTAVTSFLPITPARSAPGINSISGKPKKKAPPVPPKKRPVSMTATQNAFQTGTGHPENISNVVLSCNRPTENPNNSHITDGGVAIRLASQHQPSLPNKSAPAATKQQIVARTPEKNIPRRQSQPVTSSLAGQGITVPGVSAPGSQSEMKHVNHSKRHSMPAKMAVAGNSFPLGYGGWNPTKQVTVPVRTPREDAEEERREAQIKAYVAWVNAQLRKKPGAHLIEDLKCDMQDGVALANLIEIVAGEWLEGIHCSPSSSAEMVANVEKVIQFMTLRRIRMHQTTARDIVEGNLKSIMRLILALAAHFKPNSVKQSSQASQRVSSHHQQHHQQQQQQQQHSVAGIAHGAAAALAEARRDASGTIQRPRRPRQLRQEERYAKGAQHGDQYRLHGSGTGSDSDHSHGDMGYHGYLGPRPRLDPGTNEGGADSSGASPSASGRSSPRNTLGGLNRRLEFGMPKSKSQDFEPGHAKPERAAPPMPEDPIEEEAYNLLAGEHDVLSEDMEETKRTLLKLQELLLSGSPPDGEESIESPIPLEASNVEEEVFILRSKLQQAEEVCKDTKEELSRVKNECMQLQGVRAGLQKRLQEQENAYLALKAELLRAGFCQQSLENTKADLEHRINERDKLVLELRRELARCERELDEIKSSFQMHYHEKQNAAMTMKGQIHELHERLKLVGDTEVNLSSKVASQDRKMARLENRILSSQCDNSSRASSARSVHSTGSDDLQVVRDSLRNLRTRFPGEDPEHHTIDTLEQSISSLMDRLHVTEQSSHNRSDNGSRRMNYDSTGDVRRSPITALPGFPVQRLDNSQTNGNCTTKVLYFTDRTVTPFMCTIPKRLGDITLRDIKMITDRQGNFRYHFKAMDPEFGTVKEEITHDDDIVPGWEGKIVAWIEEDHG